MSSRIHAARPTGFISTTAVATAAIGLLMLTAASASASASAATSAATTIYACVSKKTGSMRIVSAKAKCKRGEHKLSWNASGPAGVPGATGAAGSPGAAGINGVGADYASSVLGPTELAASEVVVTKTIPAGRQQRSQVLRRHLAVERAADDRRQVAAGASGRAGSDNQSQ
jgi:hypothetical protein